MSKVRVLRADPYHPVTGVMLHPLTQRIIDFARVQVPEMDPVQMAKSYLGPLYDQNPGVLLLALVDERAAVVGHVLATINADGTKRWAAVAQYRADGPVGDAGLEALDLVKRWATEMGAEGLTLTVRNTDEKWERRGYRTVRHIYHLDMNQKE